MKFQGKMAKKHIDGLLYIL